MIKKWKVGDDIVVDEDGRKTLYRIAAVNEIGPYETEYDVKPMSRQYNWGLAEDTLWD